MIYNYGNEWKLVCIAYCFIQDLFILEWFYPFLFARQELLLCVHHHHRQLVQILRIFQQMTPNGSHYDRERYSPPIISKGVTVYRSYSLP